METRSSKDSEADTWPCSSAPEPSPGLLRVVKEVVDGYGWSKGLVQRISPQVKELLLDKTSPRLHY